VKANGPTRQSALFSHWTANLVTEAGEGREGEKTKREMGEASPEPGSSTAGGSPAPPRKGKSCKGCLYYSSALKSRGYNPICVGIPRSISQGHKP